MASSPRPGPRQRTEDREPESQTGEGLGAAALAVNFNNKMFEKSKWYSLLGVKAMLPFILET